MMIMIFRSYSTNRVKIMTPNLSQAPFSIETGVVWTSILLWPQGKTWNVRLSDFNVAYDKISSFTIRRHSLWGHMVWNAGRCLANLFDEHPSLCLDRTLVELGAGAGLPSIVAVLNGARQARHTWRRNAKNLTY